MVGLDVVLPRSNLQQCDGKIPSLNLEKEKINDFLLSINFLGLIDGGHDVSDGVFLHVLLKCY